MLAACALLNVPFMRSASRSLFASCALLIGVSAAACGGSTIDPSPSPASTSSTSAPPPAAPADGSGAPAVWHKAQVDATNLRIDANGWFRWSIDGCDFGGGDGGRWEPHPEGGIVLKPGPGYDFFEWSADGFRDHAVALRLTRTGDTIQVSGTMENGDVIEQTWKEGCVCPVCGGNLGPTGQGSCSSPPPEICVPQR